MKKFFLIAALIAEVAVAQGLQTPYQEEASLTLIGGVPANPSDWPASVYARMGSVACSATVVGERSLLIASHCVGNGGAASFSVGGNAYNSVCTHAPGYPANSTYDWALCLTSRPVTGIKFESVALANPGVSLGRTLRLTGYGCIRSGGGGGNDGVFRIGTAPVIIIPRSGANADIVTRGSAALCFGDSGGAAYLEKEDGSRVIVGVNSRGDISTTSYLPALYHRQFVAFAKSWTTAKAVKICGMHADAPSCRGDDDAPPPSDCKGELADHETALGAAVATLKTLKACVQ